MNVTTIGLSGPPAFGVGADAHSVPCDAGVLVQCSGVGGGESVDEQGFQPGVVDEPFDVPQIGDGGGHAGVQ